MKQLAQQLLEALEEEIQMNFASVMRVQLSSVSLRKDLEGNILMVSAVRMSQYFAADRKSE